MCGIIGIIGKSESEAVKHALKVTQHRGPDDTGIFSEALCTIGMNRLAILDISTAGHQPMFSQNERYVIVYNGEIYNFQALKKSLEKEGHQFKSNSDTEVLLHFFQTKGKEVLQHIRGMFAFAIWDRQKKKLFAARDHFGIKPFYYIQKGQQLYFSSEIKAFSELGIKPEINQKAIVQYLSLGYVPQPQTIYTNIKCLLPGQYLEFEDGQLETKTYWSIKAQDKYNKLSYKEALETTRSIFLDAVKEQIISDVPLGAFLSGGLDSTLIIAAMKAANVEKIETFSVGFDELGQSIDETNDAAFSSQWYGTSHNHVLLRQNEIPEKLTSFLAYLDQPSVDGFNTYCVSEFARKKVTVALSGLGADEIFGGYTAFKHILKSRKLGTWLPFNYSLLKFIPKQLSDLRYNQIRKLLGLSDTTALFSQSYRYYSSQEVCNDLRHLGLSPAAIDLEIYKDFKELVDPKANTFQQITQLFVQTHMGARLLRDSDAFSMSHSLELRVPFLDYRLVELAYSLPTNYHINNLGEPSSRFYGKDQLKRVLFDAFAGDLPKDFGKRKKTGFGLPFESWMKTSLKELLYDTFHSNNTVLDIKVLSNKLKKWEEGQIRWTSIWSLFMLLHWLNTKKEVVHAP